MYYVMMFQEFCKGDKSLEDEECSGWRSEVVDKLRAIIKTDPLTTTLEVAKNSVMTILLSFGIWRKLERWKSSISGCLMSWLKIKSFWSVIFFSSMQQQRTISPSDCDIWQKVDHIQLEITSSVTGPRRSSKALPKAKLAPKKGHGHCLVVCCQSDPLQLSESRQNHHIGEVCWEDRDVPETAMPAAAIGQQKGPNSSQWQCLNLMCHTTNALKVEGVGLESFASSAIFTWLFATSYELPLLQEPQQLFVGKVLPQPAGGRKYFPRVHQISKHGFLHYRNK